MWWISLVTCGKDGEAVVSVWVFIDQGFVAGDRKTWDVGVKVFVANLLEALGVGGDVLAPLEDLLMCHTTFDRCKTRFLRVISLRWFFEEMIPIGLSTCITEWCPTFLFLFRVILLVSFWNTHLEYSSGAWRLEAQGSQPGLAGAGFSSSLSWLLQAVMVCISEGIEFHRSKWEAKTIEDSLWIEVPWKDLPTVDCWTLCWDILSLVCGCRNDAGCPWPNWIRWSARSFMWRSCYPSCSQKLL